MLKIIGALFLIFALPAFALEVAELKTQLSTDHVLGSESAKIAVIEYASLTCPHCMEFHTQVMPVLQKEYIDTGKVKLIYRDYPLDRSALKGAKLAHCAARQGGSEKYFSVVKTLFHKLGDWNMTHQVEEKLFAIGKELGLEEKSLKTCFADKGLEQAIAASRLNGDTLGVNGTPSFFINGKKVENFHSPADIRRVLDSIARDLY